MGSKRFSDGIRHVVDELRCEDELQKKLTARMAGAAAQIADNHDRLIEEVATVARQDLDCIAAARCQQYTVEQLKQRFTSLTQAKTQLGLKARSWAALAAKLNGSVSQKNPPPIHQQQNQSGDVSELAERMTRMEHQLQQLQGDVQQILMIVAPMDSSQAHKRQANDTEARTDKF